MIIKNKILYSIILLFYLFNPSYSQSNLDPFKDVNEASLKKYRSMERDVRQRIESNLGYIIFARDVFRRQNYLYKEFLAGRNKIMIIDFVEMNKKGEPTFVRSYISFDGLQIMHRFEISTADYSREFCDDCVFHELISSLKTSKVFYQYSIFDLENQKIKVTLSNDTGMYKD